MGWNPTGRARVDPNNPQAWATCDRCACLWNLVDLQWQFQWSGVLLRNTRFLVCPECIDIPQQQLRAIILPPDPVPVLNPRPEPYTLEEPSFFATESHDNFATEDGNIWVLEGGSATP